MLYEITEAEARPDHTVKITWSDGACSVLDFSTFIVKGGVFAVLANPEFFVREMRILRGGIGLSWPDEVDFSADGLRYDAFPHEKSSECDPPHAGSDGGNRHRA